METKHIVVFVGILIAAGAFWLTLPDTFETHSKTETPAEPWMSGDAQHLGAHGIRVGPASDTDIRVTREGDSLMVEISPTFLQKQEAGFLASVGMLKPAESMSEGRFEEFVEALHMTVLTEDEKAGHTHGHEEGEADPHAEHGGHGGGLIDLIGK